MPQPNEAAPITFPGNEAEDSARYYSVHAEYAREMALASGQGRETPDGGFEYAGRPVIEGDTFPIDGCVDIRNLPSGEAVVVDTKSDPEGFRGLFASYDARLKEVATTDVRSVLGAVHEAVGDELAYDVGYVSQTIAYRHANPQNPGSKIGLGAYLVANKGVCLHMALSASLLGSRAAEAGLLKGQLTVDVNQRNYKGQLDAHAWGRYQPDASEGDDVFIIDPAQGFFGTLKEAAIYGKWEYFREGEKEKLFAGPVGAAAIEGATEETPETIALRKRYERFAEDSQKLLAAIEKNPDKAVQLQAVSARFMNVGRGLLVEALAAKDTFYAAQLNHELLDEMTYDLPYASGFEDPLQPEAIATKEAVTERMTRLFAVFGKQYEPGQPVDFGFVQKYAPRIAEQLQKAVG